MTLRSVPIDSITEGHLRSLIEDGVAELRAIEYKRELPGQTNGDKKEFLADVCSFANTAGGDLLYGITESGGTPRKLVGLAAGDVDAAISRLENSIRDGIKPRIQGIRSQPVWLENGEPVLVIRVPRSFSRPHVVTYKNHWKFYARSSNGKHQMDVDEVRQAFVLSESVADKIRAFRADRLGRVFSGETPVAISGTARLVLHMAPLSAYDSLASSVNLDLSRPPLSSIGGSQRYNFDGVLWDRRLAWDTPLGAEAVGYVQLFRTGVLEAVDNSVFVEEEETSAVAGHIDGSKLDNDLIKRAHDYLGHLSELGVEPPIFLMLSLVGVRGYRMLDVPPNFRSMHRPIDRDDLVVPEVMVESLEQDPPALQRLMRPLLDAVWNAGGLPHSLSYDESGN